MSSTPPNFRKITRATHPDIFEYRDAAGKLEVDEIYITIPVQTYRHRMAADAQLNIAKVLRKKQIEKKCNKAD